jgi:hypothetical protein
MTGGMSVSSCSNHAMLLRNSSSAQSSIYRRSVELVSIDSEAQYAVYCTGMSGILPAFQGELVPCGARVGY